LLLAGGCVSFFVEVGGELDGVVAAFAFNSFLHLDRNFTRSLPCKPFASACFEHSMDSGDFSLVGCVFVAARAAVAAAVIAAVAKVIMRDFISFILAV
jgi:hypothetical protein